MGWRTCCTRGRIWGVRRVAGRQRRAHRATGRAHEGGAWRRGGGGATRVAAGGGWVTGPARRTWVPRCSELLSESQKGKGKGKCVAVIRARGMGGPKFLHPPRVETSSYAARPVSLSLRQRFLESPASADADADVSQDNEGPDESTLCIPLSSLIGWTSLTAVSPYSRAKIAPVRNHRSREDVLDHPTDTPISNPCCCLGSALESSLSSGFPNREPCIGGAVYRRRSAACVAPQPRAVPGEATRGRGRQPPGSRRRRSAPIHAAHVPPRAAAVGRAQATHALLAVHGAGRTPAPAHRPQLRPLAPRAPVGGDGLHDVLRFVRSLRQHRVPPRHHRAWTPLAAAAHAAAVAHVACDCSRLHLLAPAPALVRSLLPPRAPHLPPAPPPPPPSLSRPSTLKPSFNSVRSKRLRRLRTNEGRTPRGP
jgi:hypothetical protein